MPVICSFNRIQTLALLIVSLVVITILIILFFYNYPSFARNRVIESVRFSNGSDSLKRFQNTNYVRSLRVKIYLFNVTNAQEVINLGSKIKLEEIGPFTYMEYREKEFIDNNQSSGLITYKIRKRYTYNKDLSTKLYDPSTTRIYWPNIPLLVAQDFISRSDLKIPKFLIWLINLQISKSGERAFTYDTVENFLFNGSYSPFFASLQKQFGFFLKPWPLKNNRFGIFYDKNYTWYPSDPIYTMSAGFGSGQTIKDLNKYVLVNGSTRLPFWRDNPPNCNLVGGTDGQFFRPFLEDSVKLQIYSSDLCRKVDFKFDQITSVTGVQALRYSLDKRSLMSGRNNPDNQCYCPVDNSNSSRYECDLDGLVDLSSCIKPGVIASGAHFMYGSDELLEQVDGVTPPDAVNHQPWVFVEPNTGITLKVRVPIQLNMRMTRGTINLFNFMPENKSLIAPLLWINEENDLTEDQASELKSQLFLLDSWFVTMVLGGAIFFIIVILIIVLLSCMRYRHSEGFSNVETEPLLSEAAIANASDNQSRTLGQQSPHPRPRNYNST